MKDSLYRLRSDLKALDLFNEIDFYFAEFIVKEEACKENADSLYMACLCLSYYATSKHSLLPLAEVHGQDLFQFCSSDHEGKSGFKLNFPEEIDWLVSFSKTIGDENENKPLVYHQKCLYLNKYFTAETKIIDMIQKLSSPLCLTEKVVTRLNELFKVKKGFQVHNPDWQKVAAFMALRNKFCVISGGPGTGKTTTVGKILALLVEQNKDLKIDLLAPTGKAADRLSESIKKTKESIREVVVDEVVDVIPDSASTIHRYLGYHGGTKKTKYHELYLTSSDLILIDECSMVDLPLFKKLLSALKPTCRVIMLGDKDQLTAVETGNVLGDLTSNAEVNKFSEVFCNEYESLSKNRFDYVTNHETILSDLVLKLEHSFRFKEDQGIGQLAGLINASNEATSDSDFQNVFNCFGSDISLKPLPSKLSLKGDQCLSTTLSTFFKDYKNILKKCKADSCSENIQEVLTFLSGYRILCATRKGEFGVQKINEHISKDLFYRNDQSLYHGKCIMIRRNQSNLNLYNGDVGVILFNNENIPMAYFSDLNGESRSFLPVLLSDYETAFAMTIHKSQGSEYNRVTMMLSPFHVETMSKELVYTGVTRAKTSVEIFADSKVFYDACRRKTHRISGLRNRLTLP